MITLRGEPSIAQVEGSEKVMCDTAFGTVTDRRVTYLARKSWFSSGSQEDLPIRRTTSVRLETARQCILGATLAVIGLVLFAAGTVGILIGLVSIGIAVLCFWGSPKVFVNTAGVNRSPASGFPWTKPQAETFVIALQTLLFRGR
jgi:hypothetical protein